MTSETATKEASSSTDAKKEDIVNTVTQKTKQIADVLQKVSKPVFETFVLLIPKIIDAGQKLYATWIKLDDNIIKSIIGFVFCFFGGMYPTVFAGVQAAEQGGRALVVKSIGELSEEATRIIDESKKDDKESIAKEKLSNQEFMKRKTLFVLKKMNPEKVNRALRNIYSVWLAVISVLVVQFARTIQMANTVAEFLEKPADKYLQPVVKATIPPEYQQWVPIIISWTSKTVGMYLAWTLTSIQAAFVSSMQGGLMLARSGNKALRSHKITLGGLIQEDQVNANLDEYAAYGFAAIGFCFQMYFRLNPPFPLNIILSPFSLGEWALRYGMMKATAVY
mmetsp:Transcript_21089/g.45992  ORF Transcript_21089/g.45992 Transcript_21089/m.45992 type:complete len:336 (+) Transcript_21089:183-1190(+)|eukprot:CAMPEP_0168190926 /NCGR_PEP_ID=MMETSP0139_2-20121125/17190_1 /TAXON_ID=44445 /ORGANISM="Pseudo-nitzschia australis, Strain 10249 10 AB" /LENGTH=335 /DNA_ID=CAMNT_0008113961 /DNA_START=150 /DNA_END=1157 /DNA_ORIENTATION=-